MTHTKGPWVMDEHISIVWGGKDREIICGGNSGSNKDDAANMLLICAAPDMLEALELLINEWDSESHVESMDLSPAINAARKAANKAKGL